MRDELPERWNAAEHFIGRHLVEGRGDRVALLGDFGALRYAELDDRVRRFAAALAAAGLATGDRVAVVAPDGPLFVTAFWGTLAAGGVALALNPLLPGADRAALIGAGGARVVVGDPDLTGAWSEEEVARKLAAAAPAAYARTGRDDLAFLLASSGTTGRPKLVAHRHRDPWMCARAFGAAVLAVGPDDRAFSVARASFAYGLGNAQYHPFAAGAAGVLCAARPTPEVVLEQLARHRPTLFFAVPTAYAQLLAALDGGARAELDSVRLFISAGEALPAGLLERWRARTGRPILDGLGSTEACHTFLSNRPDAWRAGSCGLPVPGYEVAVVDDAGRAAAPGELGELRVRGASIFAGYFGDEAATGRVLDADGWLRTGDKVRVDTDGYHFHAGRADDLFKVSGMWVSPVEVEAALAEHPAVRECAVIGRRDADGLVRPHAFIALNPGFASSAALHDAILARIRSSLAHYKCPRALTVVDALPRTPTGKLRRYLLRHL